MQRHLFAAAVCALIAMPLAFSAARADDDPMKHLINNPNPASLVIYGPQTNKKIKDASVQGGAAIEVKATGVGESYAAAAQTSLDKPIKAGDQIECDIFLKAKRDDGQPAVLHSRVQINEAPYTNVGAEADFNVTGQWALYTLKTTADKDYAAGKLVFVVHLNSAKQTVDIGPAFVFNNSETY
ncbi:hypothetical protein [Asticcacaulis sp. EMRT-3]|uniref:hypothetical protein n=1 Tax=Asticcacaulis sp. EMRT-3 TaxID=3040349 RepID=UPI0024AF6167|nr:hypothetical protein [Asticcacaulis sp. EMRT-3]MDI7774169.1 hypothetical protein [Asticcacaulis sp. EMRT-3]